jgi:hypothetical protein
MLDNPQEWVYLGEDMPKPMQQVCSSAYKLHLLLFNPNRHAIGLDEKYQGGKFRLVFIRKELQTLRNYTISLLRSTKSKEVIEEKVDTGDENSKTVIQKIEDDMKSNEKNIMLQENEINVVQQYASYLKNMYQYLSLIYVLCQDLRITFYMNLSYYPEDIPLSRPQLIEHINDTLTLISEYIIMIERYEGTMYMTEQEATYFTKDALDQIYTFRNYFDQFGQDKLNNYLAIYAPTISRFIKKEEETKKQPEQAIYNPIAYDMLRQELLSNIKSRSRDLWLKIVEIKKYATDPATLSRKMFGYSADDMTIFHSSIAEAALKYVGLIIPFEKAKELPKLRKTVKVPGIEEPVEVKTVDEGEGATEGIE